MLDNITNFPRVETIVTQSIDTELPRTESPVTESEAQPNSASPSDSLKTPVLKAVKLPYQATHQVELLHLHAEIEALLQQVRTLKQQRLSEPEGLNSEHMNLSECDRPLLAIR
jgi:hypothetical protein